MILTETTSLLFTKGYTIRDDDDKDVDFVVEAHYNDEKQVYFKVLYFSDMYHRWVDNGSSLWLVENKVYDDVDEIFGQDNWKEVGNL